MSTEQTIRIGVWNCEWKTPKSVKGKRIAEKLAGLDADILCVTEGYRNLFSPHGNVISSHPDCGYPIVKDRRKVLLWTRDDWIFTDQIGSPTIPKGRYVSGVTETPLGFLTVLGLCIPWHMAHVTSGKKNRKLWEDHLSYLNGLKDILLQHEGQPIVVLGDFNQTVPRGWQPKKVFAGLVAALEGQVEIATSGCYPEPDKPLIDHVAHSRHLEPVNVDFISRFDDDGQKLSDHNGVVVELGSQNPKAN
jgi:endonuclease/exonuclease/phosphatase family metal-dependent hydrolase